MLAYRFVSLTKELLEQIGRPILVVPEVLVQPFDAVLELGDEEEEEQAGTKQNTGVVDLPHHQVQPDVTR